ncbi:Pre-rRNA-processing protein TSR2-domain-containing protein [Leucosporidium creatinivorum]|uniref:Pre-rRNA-processing protein TSR2-domain-containing protein n=1 Tax=Leucosporidium creatinivorum TaxID=106004 RepID=A0A1Y2DDS0_9BASI|nr:Pre-rRNA-processing protein TSR2-domain-containing protein [Leucosporidium creatinivorum]
MASAAPSVPDLVLGPFAKSTIDILHVWPALRIAISQGWGGAEGRIHLAEDIVDLFYTTAAEAVSETATITAETALVPDQDDIEAVLLHVLSHAFNITLEDGSEATIAKDLTALWKECVTRVTTPPPHQPCMIERFAEAATKAKAEDGVQRYGAQRAGDDDSDSDDESGEDSDEEMEGVEEAPVASSSRPKEEPVVDDDGFQMVTKKGGRR